MTSWLSSGLISHPAIQATGWALLHFVWQGLAIAALCGLLLVVMRRQTPTWRYAVGCLGLGLMACAPIVTFVWLLVRPAIDGITALRPEQISTAQASDLGTHPLATEFSPIRREPFAAMALARANPVEPDSVAQPGGNETAASGSTAWNSWDLGVWRVRVEPYLPAGVAGWLCGVFALSLRLAGGLRRIRRWRSDATPLTEPALVVIVGGLAARMRLKLTVDVRLTHRISVPAVVGWLRPVILVPASMVTGLTSAEWESIFAHELAHIRRHDYLVNILQTVVETVLFYHPAVWWISERVRAEREHCCDDLAVAACGNRLAFARALARMEELRCGEERLAMAASGGSLLSRIRRLVADESCDRPARAAVGTVLAAGTLVMALAGWAFVVSRASGSDSSGAEQDPSPPTATELQRAEERWPAADAPFEKRKYEVQRTNSKTGVERGVFSGIRLRSDAGNSARVARLDMMYSNLMPYSFIPARVAAELQAASLGEIDFGAKPPPKPQPFQAQWVDLPELRDAKTLPPPPPPAPKTSPKTVTVDQVAEPVSEGVQIVPYNDDPVWVPEHLAFYGVNPSGQTRFQVVRIDGVDLGVGPRFGPINALVLADENSDYGVLGSDWVVRVRGDRGEGLWFYAAEGAFYFMAEGGQGNEAENGREGSNASAEKVVGRDEKSSGLPAGVPPPSVPENAGAMTMTQSGHDPEPGRIDQPGVRVLASHTYHLNRRQSTGWVTLRGAEVPIDEGVHYDKWIVYNTLFSDIVAVDAKTKVTRWSLDWNKREPTWQTLSVVAVDWSPELAVELFATDGRARELIYRYVKLSDGTPLPRPDDWRPLSQEPATSLPQIAVVERDGDRVTRAAAQSVPGGRSPAEMIEHLLAARPDHGFESGGSITNMETIVSAEKPNYLMGAALDAAEVRFNLPEGAGLRAEFSGERVEIQPEQERVLVTITNGKLELIDAGGVVRATASPDGGAEQLLIDCRMESGEVTMLLRTQRIEPSPEYPHPPVQARMNVDTGAPQDEGDPPHGAIRYEIQPAPTDKPQPVRMKMKWWYDLRRLQEEAQRADHGVVDRRLSKDESVSEQDQDSTDNGETVWGPKPSGGSLRLRLQALDPRPKVGEPLRLKLEIKNDGDQVERYDPQNYAPFRVLKVTRSDGQADQFIGLTPQTSGGPVELKPGETQVLWESVDATELYLLDEGKYRIQVVAPQGLAGTLPESNTIQVELGAGEQRPLKRLVRELAKDLPEHWRAHQVFDSLALSFIPTNLKRDAAEIQIWFTPIPRDATKALGTGDQQRTVITLGHTDLGWAHVAADQRAGAAWPQYLDFVTNAFSKARIEVRQDGPKSLEDPPKSQTLNDTPWTVTGTVTDGSGEPLAGVEVVAHCGMGTLRQTGSTQTAADGKYELKFGPGILLTDRHSLQMATISARLAGHFEKNLGRQGDLMAAFAEPQGEIGRGEKKHQNLVLPDQPKTVDFVLLPASRLRGLVIEPNGRRPEGVSVSLTGPELPPSSSVLAQVRTNAQGEFEIDNIPTGYKFQLLVEPAKAEPPWLAWASPLIEFTAGESGDTHLQYAVDGKSVDFSCQHLHLILQGEGVNWKTALAAAADRPLELKWDGLSTDKVVRAGMAFLELK